MFSGFRPLSLIFRGADGGGKSYRFKREPKALHVLGLVYYALDHQEGSKPFFASVIYISSAAVQYAD